MYIFFLFLFLVDSIRIPSSISKVNNLCDNFFETDTIEYNNYSMLVNSLNLFLSLQNTASKNTSLFYEKNFQMDIVKNGIADFCLIYGAIKGLSE